MESIQKRWLAERFEAQRARLRAVAYRILGSPSEADDAVQEAWLRLHGSDADAIENLGAWLTTVVARVCLDLLRSRKSRREETIEGSEPKQTVHGTEQIHPDADILLADSIGPALLVVLDKLEPAERVAFVLHDVFDLSFMEIATIVGRSEAAARQLASRARRRVRGVDLPDADFIRRREIVKAFLAASREGNFDALLVLLDPDVVLRADNAAIQAAAANQGKGAPMLQRELRGAEAVAQTFKGRAGAAQLALVDGAPGAVWAPSGTPRVAFVFTIRSRKVIEINLLMEPASIDALDIGFVSD